MMEKETIDYGAVLHIPLSQYAFANSEHSLTIRIRVKKHDLTECILYYADRVCRTTPIDFYEYPMTVCAEDEFYEYYEAELNNTYSRVCYYFKLIKNEEWTYYYADRFTKKLGDIYIDDKIVDGRSEYYQYPFILRNEILDVPTWFKNAVVYNIFPDSFATSNKFIEKQSVEKRLEDGRLSKSRVGGTIKGIAENLDYFQSMGFTCLYLNPIFIAGEYHKYDVLDYYHVDPCLGSDDDFRELVEEIHKRGMKIVIDGVFNHCSWYFFAFGDVVEKGANSRYCKWFYDLQFPVVRPETSEEIPNYMCFAYERKMPKLDISVKEVQNYFSDVGAYWIREFHVDGWRLDVANEIDRNFWRKFRAAVKEVNPEAVLIGEVWENAETWLRGDAFDSVMNYEFRRICKEYIATEEANAIQTAYQFEKMLLRYPSNIVKGQLNLLDTHDVPRFLSLCHGDMNKWRQACIILLFMPGVPSIFYGDEQGITGILENEYRSPMTWKNEYQLVEFLQRLIEIKKEYVNVESEYHPLWKWIESGVFAFERYDGEKGIGIAINRENKVTIELDETKELLLSFGYENKSLSKNGYLIYSIKKSQG